MLHFDKMSNLTSFPGLEWFLALSLFTPPPTCQFWNAIMVTVNAQISFRPFLQSKTKLNASLLLNFKLKRWKSNGFIEWKFYDCDDCMALRFFSSNRTLDELSIQLLGHVIISNSVIKFHFEMIIEQIMELSEKICIEKPGNSS